MEGYRRNHLDEPVPMAWLKPLLIKLGIHYVFVNLLLHVSESFNNNRIARGEPGPRGIWGRVQGVGLVQRVTRSGLVCDSPYGMASGGQEEPFSRLALAV